MRDIRIISWSEHANKRWFKLTDFRFAAKDSFVAIGFSEIPKAMLSLPLALVKNEESFNLAVVQGLVPGQNLLVTPQGQWVADYIPVLYGSLPFKLAKSNDKYVLCVDHDSGLVTDMPAGHQFFEEDKKLAPEANAIAGQLMQFEAERPRMLQACKLLAEHGVIEPWPLQVQNGDKIEPVEGLFRIKEAKLMELPSEALADIRNSGGLMLCYAQLFSMQHMQQLGTVAQRNHWAARAAALSNKVAALDIVDDNGILSFANL